MVVEISVDPAVAQIKHKGLRKTPAIKHKLLPLALGAFSCQYFDSIAPPVCLEVCTYGLEGMGYKLLTHVKKIHIAKMRMIWLYATAQQNLSSWATFMVSYFVKKQPVNNSNFSGRYLNVQIFSKMNCMYSKIHFLYLPVFMDPISNKIC